MPRPRKDKKDHFPGYEEKDNQKENERYFLDPEAVSRHLFCSICQDVFTEPQRAPCGHSFCKTCIYTWLKHKKNCPEDRRPLKLSDLHYDFIVANVIGDHTVACPFRRRGCEFLGKLDGLSTHCKTCVFNPGNLPAFLHKERSILSVAEQSHIAVSSLSLECSLNASPLPGLGLGQTVGAGSKLPTPAKPSLKMRLFCQGGGQRDLLCSMFAGGEDPSSTAAPTSASTPAGAVSSSSSASASSATSSRRLSRKKRKIADDDVIILDTP